MTTAAKHWFFGCATKRFYRDEEVARIAAKRSAATFRKPMYFYRCDHCSGFHVTSKKPRDKGRRDLGPG